MNSITLNGQPHRDAPTLGDIINWFKTMSTNEYIHGIKSYGWQQFKGKLWQRNYYEHIVRNEDSLNRIREYVANNPLKWEDDIENPLNNKEENAKAYYGRII
jgi:REP element-mobilizing transposase RayT